MYLLLTVAMLLCAPADRFEVSTQQEYQVADLSMNLEVTAVKDTVDDTGEKQTEVVANFCGAAQIQGLEVMRNGRRQTLVETPMFVGGKVQLEKVFFTGSEMQLRSGDTTGRFSPDVRHVAGFWSIIPPLFAILLALLTRQALIALFAGVWAGAIVIYNFNPLTALVRVFDTHLVASVADPDHAAIILFTMALGGMVGVLAKSGGTQALVEVISQRAKTRRGGLVMGWFTGLIVFFDDYANCLLVGNTLRPFTDKMKISREKLSYIVDSTAAPITSVALISTWVGYQLGLLTDFVAEGSTPYDLFLSILPYSFYSLFTIFFVFFIAVSCRDYGPMLKAERRAFHTGKVLRDGAQPMMDKELTEMRAAATGRSPHWSLAVVPIAAVILIVAAGLFISGGQSIGFDNGLREIIASANSYAVLLWAGFGGSLIGAGYAMARRNLTLTESVDAWVAGCKAMAIAVLILVLAWAIGDICKNFLQTGPWVISQFSPSPHWIPTMTFVLCAVIALATGSSFSTMAIVIPIAGPMAWAATGDASGMDPAVVESIRFATLGSVLSGAVFGDHCSPISDTTIMSSMSCAADHIDHVRTQVPYAVTCGAAAILLGTIPAGYGFSPWHCLWIGIACLAVVVFRFGKRVDLPEGC